MEKNIISIMERNYCIFPIKKPIDLMKDSLNGTMKKFIRDKKIACIVSGN